MSAPCRLTVSPEPPDSALSELWDVQNHDGDTLKITIAEVLHDSSHELGVDPGLQKDGVEAHLQVLLAENPATFGDGWTLVTREYLTPIGPVDLLFRDHTGAYVAVEVKRRGEIDGVEQLTRYLALMNADPAMKPVRGVFAAQQIKPQARTLAGTRGIDCILVDYDLLRGLDNAEDRLF
jgi:RecB family endonuclease NucS